MDKIFKDIHILYNDEEVMVHRGVIGTIKVCENSIEFMTMEIKPLQTHTKIVLPFTKGITIKID